MPKCKLRSRVPLQTNHRMLTPTRARVETVFCDYCDVYLTHDSMSVRKAHNSGRNHLRNVIDYYQQIGHEKAQSVIDSITSSYAAEGQAHNNPMLPQNQPGGGLAGLASFPPPAGMPPFPFPGGMPPPGFPGMPGLGGGGGAPGAPGGGGAPPGAGGFPQGMPVPRTSFCPSLFSVSHICISICHSRRPYS